jgi:hypothetical protein
VVELWLDDRSFAYWDPGQGDWGDVAGRFTQISPQLVEHQRRAPGWQVDAGTFEVLIGRSSADISGRASVEVVPA